MTSMQSGEGEIRRRIVDADLIDCMVALPAQLFYGAAISACLWFVARERRNGRFRDRSGSVLFIDARKLGGMADRTHRELRAEDIARIADAYHSWRAEKDAPPYADVPGYCRSVSINEIHDYGHVLTPGRYVGAEAHTDSTGSFEDRIEQMTAAVRAHMAESRRLDAAIDSSLRDLSSGG